MTSDDRTLALLRCWHEGDRSALSDLIERDREWILGQVRRRRGPMLQREAETDDDFQDLMVEVLDYAPRFLVANRQQFRRLLARMIDNMLVDRVRQINRRRPRDGAALQTWAAESRLCLDPALQSSAAPSALAARAEELEWLRLGLEFLGEDERQIVRGHKVDGRSFVDLGEELGLQANTVRMRCNRALLHLAGIIRRLQTGDLERLLEERGD